MNRPAIFLMLTLLLLVPQSLLRAQGIPAGFNYQGRLFDPDANLGLGAPVTGEQQVTFRLYDAGNGGNVVWARTLTVFCNDEGKFNLVVSDAGDVVAGEPDTALIEVLPQYTTLYMGLQVGAGDEIEPLQQLVATPYAQVAEAAGTAVTSVRAGTAEEAEARDATGPEGGFSIEDVPSGQSLRVEPNEIEAPGDLNVNVKSGTTVSMAGRLTYQGSILGPLQARAPGTHTETRDGFIFIQVKNANASFSQTNGVTVPVNRLFDSGNLQTNRDEACVVVPVFKGVAYTLNRQTSSESGVDTSGQFFYRAVGP